MARKKYEHEDAELEQAFENLTANNKSGGKYAKQGSGTKNALVITLISIAAIAVIVGIVLGSIYMIGPKDSDLITQNVTVAGVNVYGMTRAEATQAVSAATAGTYSTKDMVVTFEDQVVTIPAAQAKPVLDVDAAVDGAVDYEPTEAAHEYILDLTPYMSLDANAIQDALDGFSQFYDSDEVPNKYEVRGNAPADLKSPAEGEGQTLVLTIGTPCYGIKAQDLFDAVIAAYNSNQFQIDYTLSDNPRPTPVDLDAVYAQFCTDVKNAEMDKETFEITPEVYGYRFDLEAAKKQQDEAEFETVLEFPFAVVVPEVDSETLSATLFCDVLSEHTTSGNSASGRVINLRLACEAVNGVVLNPGEVFDYNETLGERTSERGYQYGATYVGGKTIQSIGGGICQVSSTIYYCSLLADMEIVTRSNHGYVVGYLPLGMDATVSWGGPEFRFKNNSNYPIKIEASADGGKVTIRILGTDDKDYYVKMTYDVLATYGAKTIEEIIDPENNPKGYTDGEVITSPYTGYTVRAYRNRYEKDTDKLIESVEESMSYYNKRDKVVAKIKAPEETAPSTEATTPPSSETETTAPSTTAPVETTTPPTETTAPPTETTVPPTETTAPPTETTAPPTETTAPPTEATAAPTEPPATSEQVSEDSGSDEGV